jgi:hypothetical protein
MLIRYRVDLTHFVKLIKTGTFYIWLEILKEIISTEKNVLLGAIYFPPPESPYFNEDNFPILEGNVLVCGNLNARCGQEPDTLSTQGDKHIPGGNIPSPICPTRHNYDNITNKNRSQLLQLCRTLGLYIVNGRLQGDFYGRYTYSSTLGNSTVDYFITDLNLESLRAFTVSPLTSLSDKRKSQFI